ncbi:MAG TPA: hypothetical protein PL182_12235, partial [Pseudobdellovibrionaceae bacterium]|nr:hypothetical protein [Pseudobdellovibrionaceae bacterium]
ANFKSICGRQQSRVAASWQAGGLVLLLSLFPSLSSTVFRNWRGGLIENIDSFLVNWILPVSALGLLYAIVKGMGFKSLEENFVDRERPRQRRDVFSLGAAGEMGRSRDHSPGSGAAGRGPVSLNLPGIPKRIIRLFPILGT